jgi:hypothetical protein
MKWDRVLHLPRFYLDFCRKNPANWSPPANQNPADAENQNSLDCNSTIFPTPYNSNRHQSRILSFYLESRIHVSRYMIFLKESIELIQAMLCLPDPHARSEVGLKVLSLLGELPDSKFAAE